jgi:choice-of-anchor A domain-containing protein
VFGVAGLFNAFIAGDFTVPVAGDTEGRLAVGGTADIQSGYSVGMGGGFGQPLPVQVGAAQDAFIVGGDLFDGAWGVNGNIVFGGERIGPKRFMSNGNVVRKQNPITFDDEGNVPYDGSGLSFAEIMARLIDRSTALAALPAQGVVRNEREPGNYGNLVLTGNHPDLNVFEVTAADWNSTSTEILVSAPAGATVLINVTGGPIEITYGSMRLEGVSREQVLIHYTEATSITTTGFSHEGSVLAPYTDAVFHGGAINGRGVFGGSVLSLNGF